MSCHAASRMSSPDPLSPLSPTPSDTVPIADGDGTWTSLLRQLTALPHLLPHYDGLVRSDEIGTSDQVIKFSLCEAVCSNNIPLVHALLCAGRCNPNSQDSYGNTPLHMAAEQGLTVVAKMLVWAGADMEARAGVSGDVTPLLLAAANCHTATATALLDLGADPRAADSLGSTALEIAARSNNVRLMLALIRRGALVDSRSSSGWTPLHVAAGFNHPTAIATLVRFGASPNTLDNDGDSPLITACSLGHTDCVQQLLDGGADLRQLAPVR